MLEVLLSCMSIVEVERDSKLKEIRSIKRKLLKFSFLNLKQKKCKLKQKSQGNCYVQFFQIWLNMTAIWGDVGQQHDANEFFVKVISPLVEEVGELFHI